MCIVMCVKKVTIVVEKMTVPIEIFRRFTDVLTLLILLVRRSSNFYAGMKLIFTVNMLYANIIHL